MTEKNLQEEDRQLLTAALDLGERLLECGGEISRVEDTIRRICSAYGAARTDVFAITSSIVVTMEREGRITTQTRRITGGRTDYARLEDLNALSRGICSECPPVSGLRSRVRSAEAGPGMRPVLQLAGYLLAAGAFAVFFGGGLSDAACAALCAVIVFLLDRRLKPAFPSSLLYLLVCSVITGAAALLCSRAGLCASVKQVMTGDIMLLIPGIALTNAIRDLFMGDTISGMLRLMEALLQAGAIACGFALAVLMGGVIG